MKLAGILKEQSTATGKTSPYKLLQQMLERAGYRVTNKIMNAGEYGGKTSRERVFIQAMREDLHEALGGTEATVLEQRLHDMGLHKTHRVEDGFVWPRPQAISKEQHMATVLLPWHQVPEEYHLPRGDYGKYKCRPREFAGAVRMCYKEEDLSIGTVHEPTTCYSKHGLAPSITALATSSTNLSWTALYVRPTTTDDSACSGSWRSC